MAAWERERERNADQSGVKWRFTTADARVKPNGAADYLFNIQSPEGTVKAVAESAMREVIGRSEIQPILTGARQNVETAVQELIQRVLDSYQAGISITQVQMQKVDPPSQVIDAFRDVQAARADAERAQNEAQTYANQVVPEASRERIVFERSGTRKVTGQTKAAVTARTPHPEKGAGSAWRVEDVGDGCGR